jgi:exosortase C (VPDSG-CTERM-specific)
VRLIGFPLAFLLFLAPFPAVVETGLETMLQHGSSWIANKLFELASMPVYREGTFFQLPGFSMQVAPECSGIRSTLALFLTSLVAGQMFMRSPWKRALLALIILPIALLRNGFRVFVIGELCVQVGPHMINSWIHRHGGPAFFALSLIPFSIILFLLYRSDLRSPSAAQSTP